MPKMEDWYCPKCGSNNFDIEYNVTDNGLSLEIDCEHCDFEAETDVMIGQFEYEDDEDSDLD